jgi:co-chaperonin GroES (HSP10)
LAKLIPLHDRVLVKRDPAAEKAGSIILTTGTQEPPRTGQVHAVGTKCEFVHYGERVLFSPYAGVQAKAGDVDDPDLLIMSESEILAIIDEEA